jgi:hypothetical protein
MGSHPCHRTLDGLDDGRIDGGGHELHMERRAGGMDGGERHRSAKIRKRTYGCLCPIQSERPESPEPGLKEDNTKYIQVPMIWLGF